MSVTKHFSQRWPLFLLIAMTLLIGACSQTVAPVAESIAEPATAPEPTTAPTDAPALEEAPATVEPTSAPAQEVAASPATPLAFVIDGERSQVRFVIDEVLRGQPTTVTGVNNQVNGNMLVDPSNPAATEIGMLTIGAGAFVTDSGQRNGAIQRFILQSGQHPTITFAPTQLSGLPASATVGDSFDFQVSGDLTIRDITNPVTFDVTANIVSDGELQLSGSTQILRGDFSLSIPQVPFVASVTDEVALEFDLVAVAE